MTLRLCNAKQQQAKQCKKLKAFRKIFLQDIFAQWKWALEKAERIG